MVKNITYLLGAGASYNSCPILNELGNKMIEMSQILKNDEIYNNDDFIRGIIDDIEYFGKKAIEYGTIDIYARKLYLNDYSKLEKLKMAISVFFTLWHKTDNIEKENLELKKRNDKNNIKFFEMIDKRYMSLLATILEKQKVDSLSLKIKDNINFVTWNYDLQLERALKKFCNDGTSWKELHNQIAFNIKENENLKICHLNGYHGFFETDFMPHKYGKKEINLLDRITSTNPTEIIQEIFSKKDVTIKYESSFVNYINYAWETKNKFSKKAREQAKKIFSKTDILIIIGYSFPPFNKRVDKELFKELGKQNTEIFYQDPNAVDEFIKELFDTSKPKITCIKNKNNYFHLPYSF